MNEYRYECHKCGHAWYEQMAPPGIEEDCPECGAKGIEPDLDYEVELAS